MDCKCGVLARELRISVDEWIAFEFFGYFLSIKKFIKDKVLLDVRMMRLQRHMPKERYLRVSSYLYTSCRSVLLAILRYCSILRCRINIDEPYYNLRSLHTCVRVENYVRSWIEFKN